MSASLAIGIDLGGTKIAGIALDLNGRTLTTRRVTAPRGNYDDTVSAIVQLVEAMERELGSSGSVGIGIPGSLSPATGLVQNANSTWLNGHGLDTDLRSGLGRPVAIANDANCFALSEAVDGAGAGAPSVFGVIIGTGCGGGLVIGQELVDGPMGIGGEWGHNPLPWATPEETPGPPCWCGRMGCIETWVSGPGLASDYAHAGGGSISAQAIAALAAEGDQVALAAREAHAGRLARALGGLVNIIDPHVIVLGGGLSQMRHLYDDLPRLMAPFIFADQPSVDIRAPKHGAASGVRGAAWLWGRP